MTRTATQILLLAAVLVAVGWFVLSPGPEPAIAAIMGLVAVLSLALLTPEVRDWACDPHVEPLRGRDDFEAYLERVRADHVEFEQGLGDVPPPNAAAL